MYSYCRTTCNFNQVKVNMPYLNSFQSLKSHTSIRHILIRGAQKKQADFLKKQTH
jgi:hypothetical protein